MAAKRAKTLEPTIENRKARHDYVIENTLECGIELRGTEVKSIRNGQASLGEGYVRATEEPLGLELIGVHIAEYPNASQAHQHAPTRTRRLLAWKREIKKLVNASRERGVTIVPLKMYFSKGKVKLLVGIGRGKRKGDQRQDISKREARKEIDRAMSRKR